MGEWVRTPVSVQDHVLLFFQILEDFILPCKKMLSSAHESINVLCIDDSGQMFYRILHIYDSFRYELSPCGFWKYLFETTDSRIKTGSSKKGTLANIITLNIIILSLYLNSTSKVNVSVINIYTNVQRNQFLFVTTYYFWRRWVCSFATSDYVTHKLEQFKVVLSVTNFIPGERLLFGSIS